MTIYVAKCSFQKVQPDGRVITMQLTGSMHSTLRGACDKIMDFHSYTDLDPQQLKGHLRDVLESSFGIWRMERFDGHWFTISAAELGA